MRSSKSSVLLALLAILLWSFLALMSSALNHIPSLLAVGVALTVSGIASLFTFKEWKVPLKTYLVGLWGIFGYHFLYFSAFHYAPPIEVSLMNYLWPLLIVVLSPVFLPEFKIRLQHILGALLGLCGAAVIVTGGEKLIFDLDKLPGYFLAAFAAFVWSTYSLMTKKVPKFSTKAVGGFCLGSGILSLISYVATQHSIEPLFTIQINEWLILIGLGLGPMGLAFFAWDGSLKAGDPRIIGALSYLTPLLSTSWLVLFGSGKMSYSSLLAMILIVSGAIIGSWELFFPNKTLSSST